MSDNGPHPPLPPSATVAQALAWARAQGIDRLDAQVLLARVLARPRSWLLAHDTDTLPDADRRAFEPLALRRARGEPLAYVVGEREFHGLTLRVTPDVLVPRPDTETLVDWALELLPPDRPARVLDLGTGSGAIALALARARPQAQITAVDASADALAVARTNAERLRLPLRLLHGSWFEPLGQERFDLIVSNPPYIAEGDAHLDALTFEPRQALTAGPDGLDDLRHLTAHARNHLAPNAWLLLEHGHDQADAVRALLAAAGCLDVHTRRDLAGVARCTGGHA